MTTTDRSRWLALYVLCGSMLMIVLDATIVNVALPSIQEDLGFTQNDLAWVVNAYLDADRLPARAMSATTLLSLVPLALAFLATWRLPRHAREFGLH